MKFIEDDEHVISEYPPFIINRCLSGHLDCVLFANEMNKYHFLDKDMQYKFYINILRKRKRFSPWILAKIKRVIWRLSNLIMVIVMKKQLKH